MVYEQGVTTGIAIGPYKSSDELRPLFNDRQWNGNYCRDFETVRVVGEPIRTAHADVYHLAFYYPNSEAPLEIALKHFVAPRNENWRDTPFHWERYHPAASFTNERRGNRAYTNAGRSLVAKMFFADDNRFGVGTMWQGGPCLERLLIRDRNKNNSASIRDLQRNAIDNLAYSTALVNQYNEQPDTQPALRDVEADAICRYITKIYHSTGSSRGSGKYDHFKVLQKIKTEKPKLDLSSEVRTLLRLRDMFARDPKFRVIQHGDYKLEHIFFPKTEDLDGMTVEQIITSNPRTTLIDPERVGDHVFGYDIASLLSRGPANLFVPKQDEELVRLLMSVPTLEAMYRTGVKETGFVHDLTIDEMIGQWKGLAEDASVPESYFYSTVIGAVANSILFATERQANYLRRTRESRRNMAHNLGIATQTDLKESKVFYIAQLFQIAQDYSAITDQTENPQAAKQFFRGLKNLFNKLGILQAPSPSSRAGYLEPDDETFLKVG